MNRRNFFKLASAGALLAGTPLATEAAATNRPPIPGSLGMLYDSTLCVGCQACVSKCQQVNKLDYKPDSTVYAGGAATWSNNDKLSPYTNNIIQVWRSGDGKNKDQTQNGYAYIKKQCMHCVDPNCVSVCPVSALKKDPKTGVVHYDASVCTGCRYCMVACPFNVPKYDYENPLGKLHKCELCNQPELARLDKGGMPGCVEVCPTGAVIYGTREQLLEEAKRRLALKPGDEYAYPRQTLGSNDSYLHTVPSYERYVYGEKEAGGTQVLVLAGVPYQNLEMPALDSLSTGARSEHIQHTLYKGMVLPLAVLAGLSVLVHRNTRAEREETHDSQEKPHDGA
ncbi:hydrogenase 2 operon protein HybA [Dickeya dadantii]|uniref:Hydrogenase 2 4Fe-4S ferredoxin-type component n=1 Tax=Dickeya dadantii (strain 3937) TaxID=198628 RepID=E0SKG6_DICD3|nr:hydrogenase 2 operon protein HybA [Dickeya dadantii]ADM99255.1 hydrogenase 2 4Fe-4S ferredoxin-type component [Dickeya dadantii 3937]NAT76781.1 hydrogenase 2 protein HybA [Dickeya dadantii]NPE63261.1 hydrogenase 2 operon protein HybA [Dickeya dadantii]OOC15623.1 hydrogenase 2 protein HybA [Dickeya dadantii]UAY95040.1 hydrogenase 2 operon protein HybA [Dickeya dadantii]